MGVIAMLFLSIILAIFFIRRCITRNKLRGTHLLHVFSFTFKLHPIMLKEEYSDADLLV